MAGRRRRHAGRRSRRGDAEDPQDTGDELQLRVAHEHAEGDLDVPDDIDLLEGEARDTRRGVGIVVSRFNGEIVNRLLASALAELEKAEVAKDSITVMAVPGAFELPLGAMALAKTRRYSCIVALGCVIRGETLALRVHLRRGGLRASAGSARDGRPGRLRRAYGGQRRTGRGPHRQGRRGRADGARDGGSLLAAPGDRPARRRPFRYHPAPMSRVCAVCGKKPGFGNHRSHSMVATKRRFDPNLQRVRVLLKGKAQRAYVCTKCLKAGKVQKAI